MREDLPAGPRMRRVCSDVAAPLSAARQPLQRGRCSVLVLALVAIGVGTACDDSIGRTARQITGGEPTRAAAAIRKYGCGSCHTIPGIDGASAVVGPSLARLGSRSYIAGHLTNDPDTLIRWIRHPRSFGQVTAMPEMGVGDQDARDIAAYLYTLQ